MVIVTPMNPKAAWFLFLVLSALNMALGVKDFLNDNTGACIFSLLVAAWMLYEAILIENRLKKPGK